VRVCVCVVFCMRGFDEDFKTHVKLNKSDFFGKLIIRQSENLRMQITVCISICIPQYLSLVSVLRVCVCVCGYGGVYLKHTKLTHTHTHTTYVYVCMMHPCKYVYVCMIHPCKHTHTHTHKQYRGVCRMFLV
jgi:hypothetical protein